MNRKIIVSSFILFLALVFLFICHLRYSFINSASAGWSLGVQSLESPFKLNLDPEVIYTPAWLKKYSNEQTRFLADPFVIKENGIYYLFFEHQAAGNADIALMTSTDGVNYRYKGEVLQEVFHLSFPQVFKHKGDFYMLPETKAAGNILLYKSKGFPYRWEIHDTLISNVALKDPAILLSDTLNLITAIDDNNFQYIFTADSLEGTWLHDKRYIERKGDETRAGGNFFMLNNKWYIPFQKNNQGYGSGLALYELMVKEEKITFNEIVDPFLKGTTEIKWFNKGMHHFSVIADDQSYYSAFDGDRIDEKLPKVAAWKASLKYNFYDLLRFMGL